MKKIGVIGMLVLWSSVLVARTNVWDGSRALWTRGQGTEGNPYLIETASHLAFLAYMVNKGYETEGLCFLLTNDLDLNGSEHQMWVPIGLGEPLTNNDGCDRRDNSLYPLSPHSAFRGHFDGGLHSISNIFIDNSIESYSFYAGLFGVVEGKEEKDVANPAIIENVCVVSGYIKGSICGGIVGNGSSASLISHCWNGATIESDGEGGGGIVGNNGCQVHNCYNVGNIKGFFAGGVVGFSKDGIMEIKESYNTGNVYGAYSGGIIGYSTNSLVTIKDCYNNGSVSGIGTDSAAFPEVPSSGGIAGMLFQSGHSSISNCYNVGDVFCPGASGCIIAYDYPKISFENNYFVATCTTGSEGVPLSEDYMRTQDFVDVLNGDNRDMVWDMDVNNVNAGFPVLVNDAFGVKTRSKALLSIYPNPSHGQFVVEGHGRLTITTLLGQKVVVTRINGKQTISLPPGMYLLNLSGVTQKVIVE